MKVPVPMPKVGSDTTDGRIAAWLKNPGDRVERGEDLLEVETEKATVSVQAAQAGVLVEIVHAAGAEVAGGQTIGYIEAE
jgi:pyruvate/2-oxoglutarate dehydrogenase complex dihydrolipoamide acyltransferase (E2) component